MCRCIVARSRCLAEQLGRLQKRLVSLARDDARARLLMSTPGVGVLVALTYVAAIDDPGRFKSSKATGAHFGLTPKKSSTIGPSQVRRAAVPYRPEALRNCQEGWPPRPPTQNGTRWPALCATPDDPFDAHLDLPVRREVVFIKEPLGGTKREARQRYRRSVLGENGSADLLMPKSRPLMRKRCR